MQAGPKRRSPFDAGFDLWAEMKQAAREPDARRGGERRAKAEVGFAEGVLGNARVAVTYQRQGTCRRCKGRGKLPATTIGCPVCAGTGATEETRQLDVSLPDGGVVHGQVLRLKGQGDAGYGDDDGDLYVTLSVQYVDEAARTTRDADGSLFTEVELPAEVLAKGGALPVTLVEGTKGTLQVPGNSKDGAALRVRGKGAIATAGGARGDHVFVLRAIE